MEVVFDIVYKNRKSILNLTDGLTEAEYNYIPKYNNNNIIWNMTHILSVQQLLIYAMSGTSFTIDEDYIHPFKNKTCPEDIKSLDFIQKVRDMLLPEVDVMKERYFEGKLNHVPVPFRSRLNIEFGTIEGILQFNMYHEALHMSVITQYLKEINASRVES